MPNVPCPDNARLQLDFPIGSTVRIMEKTSRWFRRAGHVVGYFSNETANGIMNMSQGIVVSFDRGKTIYNFSEAYARDSNYMCLVREGSGRF